ncbi:MAG: acyl-CoA thioesterase [Muribaculaceae bacterium]|mgnify:CR=1 FL=1|nr:acyl-CoA thioesterase [Muribaculaceae bacterium]
MENDSKARHGSIVAQHPFHCVTPVQFRFSDFDMLGHLNNTRYFDLFDLAKDDYFTRVIDGATEWSRPPMVIANINCDFLSQITPHEPVEARTQVDHIGNKSFVLVQQLVNTETGELKCACAVTMVFIDTATGTPARVTPEWRAAISRLEQREL